jgi:flavodoxin
MKRFLIVYASLTGKTKRMAEFIAEGLRMNGSEVKLKLLSKVKNADDLKGYDGYLFGSPTYHKDIVAGFKSFLFKANKAGLQGKIGGAFGSHTHSGEAPVILHETMEHVLKMNMENLGPLKMEEQVVVTDACLKTCQDFGKALGERA